MHPVQQAQITSKNPDGLLFSPLIVLDPENTLVLRHQGRGLKHLHKCKDTSRLSEVSGATWHPES